MTTIQDDNAFIRYSPGWSAIQDARCDAQNAHITTTVGSSAILHFVGSFVEVWGGKKPEYGLYNVELDGVSVLLGNATSEIAVFRQSLFHMKLQYANHTMKLTNLGPSFDIDAITFQPKPDQGSKRLIAIAVSLGVVFLVVLGLAIWILLQCRCRLGFYKKTTSREKGLVLPQPYVYPSPPVCYTSKDVDNRTDTYTQPDKELPSLPHDLNLPSGTVTSFPWVQQANNPEKVVARGAPSLYTQPFIRDYFSTDTAHPKLSMRRVDLLDGGVSSTPTMFSDIVSHHPFDQSPISSQFPSQKERLDPEKRGSLLSLPQTVSMIQQEDDLQNRTSLYSDTVSDSYWSLGDYCNSPQSISIDNHPFAPWGRKSNRRDSIRALPKTPPLPSAHNLQSEVIPEETVGEIPLRTPLRRKPRLIAMNADLEIWRNESETLFTGGNMSPRSINMVSSPIAVTVRSNPTRIKSMAVETCGGSSYMEEESHAGGIALLEKAAKNENKPRKPTGSRNRPQRLFPSISDSVSNTHPLIILNPPSPTKGRDSASVNGKLSREMVEQATGTLLRRT